MVDFWRGLKSLGKKDSQAREKKKSEQPVIKNPAEFAIHVYMYNALLNEMIRIQGIELTLEDIRKMSLSKILAKDKDQAHMNTWKALVNMYSDIADCVVPDAK